MSIDMNSIRFKLVLVTLFAYNLLFAGNNLETGIRLMNEGKYAEAKEYFKEKVKENVNDDLAYNYLGRCYLQSGAYENAIECCEKAVAINDQVADYHFWLGQALTVKLQNSNMFKRILLAPKVLDEFKKTVKLDSTHVGGHLYLGYYYLQAPALGGGDLKKAKNESAILLKLDEKQGRLLLIQIYDKENKLDLAAKEYEIFAGSFNDSTDNYQFYNNYGYFLLKQKNYDKAISMFQKQVQLAPADANAHDSLGDGFRAAGKLDEALAEYGAALKIDPNFKASQEKYQEIKNQLSKE
jgi:tetratricopeptide (TPR) repeat protein